MMPSILETLDVHLSNTLYDKQLYKAVSKYRFWYLNTTRDTLEFFGSNLLGVIPIRYTDAHIHRFYSEVIDVDFDLLSKDLKLVDSINQDFKISSDVFNITLMYCIHRFTNSKALNKKQREDAVNIVATIFFYRTLAALVANGFKYNANPAIVQAAYTNMTEQYLIKKLGNWNKVIENRVAMLVGTDSKHHKTFLRYEDDDRILYAITDAQGSMKTLVKNYYSEIVIAKDNDLAIGKDNPLIVDVDGELTLKDLPSDLDATVEEVLQQLTRPESFIVKEYVHVVSDITGHISTEDITTVLDHMSTRYSQSDKQIEEFIRDVVVYSFDYLATVRSDVDIKDLPKKLLVLKNSYISSRNKDRDFLKMKAKGDAIIKKARIGRLNKSTSIRTAIMLYIVLYTLVVSK